MADTGLNSLPRRHSYIPTTVHIQIFRLTRVAERNRPQPKPTRIVVSSQPTASADQYLTNAVHHRIQIAEMAKSMLSDEQRDFLESCEEEFKNRYTDNDAAFLRYTSTERKKPPIVDPWYNKPRRPQIDWRQGRRHQHWDKGNDRYERNERHGGRYHMYQRNSRPY